MCGHIGLGLQKHADLRMGLDDIDGPTVHRHLTLLWNQTVRELSMRWRTLKWYTLFCLKKKMPPYHDNDYDYKDKTRFLSL